MSPYVLVLFYSRNGHTAELAKFIARGAERAGIEARLRTVPPVTPQTENALPPVPDEGAPYVTEDDLRHCSALALGSPVRFGNMAAPLKYFIDSTAGLWASGALVDKPACVFASGSSMHGGQETTLLTMMMPLLHHGMLIMGLPYTESGLSSTHAGGTPYGPSHVEHKGSGTHSGLTNEELALATAQGQRLAALVRQLD